MSRTRLTRQVLASTLSAALLCAAPAARAELIGTEQLSPSAAGTAGANIAHDRQVLDTFMARADVQRKLEQLGVSPEAAQERLAALSNAEVADLAGRVQSLPAAGTLTFHEMVIILLVAILVVVAL